MAQQGIAHNGHVLPPGTIHLLELHTGSSDNVIRVPTPSDHPDDPLNWSRWRKLLSISLVLFYTFSTGVAATVVYSVFVPISEDTGITIAELNQGTGRIHTRVTALVSIAWLTCWWVCIGYLFLLAGWSNLFWQPLALTFGRRPVYLVSLVGLVAISEWTAWLSDYGSWAAARCLYGFFVAPVEVLPEISAPDIFFAHERGTYIGLYMLALSGSNYFAPMIAGFVSDGLGWRSVQHLGAIVLGVNLVLAFFLQEETMFSRSSVEAELVDQAVQDGNPVITKGDILDSVPLDSKVCIEPSVTQTTVSSGPVYARKTYLQKLAFWSYNGVSLSQFLRMMYRPILIFFTFPNIAWSGFMYGSALSW